MVHLLRREVNGEIPSTWADVEGSANTAGCFPKGAAMLGIRVVPFLCTADTSLFRLLFTLWHGCKLRKAKVPQLDVSTRIVENVCRLQVLFKCRSFLITKHKADLIQYGVSTHR